MNRVASHCLRALVMTGLLVRAVSAGDDLLKATLARMDHAAAGFTGLTAHLRKVAHTAVINDDSPDDGTIVLKRPKPHDVRMLFDVKEPEPKTYAIDPRKVQIYLPRSQTVQEYDLGKYRSMVDQFLLLGFGSTSAEMARDYSISLGGPDTVGPVKATRLVLVPKSPEMLKYIKQVGLWISDSTGIPVQQKFDAPGGDYNLATYTEIMLNPKLPDSAVTLKLPKGVKREYPQKF